MNKQVKIVNGPKKNELFESLSEGKKVTFETESGSKIVAISLIKAEDGSRNSWIINFSIDFKTHQALYNTSTKRGFITF